MQLEENNLTQKDDIEENQMITIRQKGDFSKLTKYLNKVSKAADIRNLDKYGQRGVAALSSATPKDTGLTASSWSYEVVQNKQSISIEFHNTNIQNGIPIAIILQYGHATKNGGWIEGRDYINPAIQPIFDEIVAEAWKEVTKA